MGTSKLVVQRQTKMTMRLCVALGLLALAYALPTKINVGTVEELDITKYIGRWYQTYGNRYGWLTYGDDAVCNTATYRPIDEGTISVLNHNREEPGKFYLFLEGVPFRGDYWVLRLGPVVDDMYDYSVVTNADYSTLFVLARDVNRFAELYETEVLAFLAEAGFNGYWTRPIPDSHPSDCQYPPYP